ncbi:Collagenase [Eumeta japonica]|uniref:Collagenase n=1 Tax=Eumeta variegata TaxID=151549 RepID=A0A4C1WCT1_EUMVA|nr:Collagenase [Eumeta japonica]
MKVTVLVVVLAFAVSAYCEERETYEDVFVRDYHRRIGIPRARQIKAMEEQGTAANGQRIVGGVHADMSVVPYQVGLIIQLIMIFTSVCGGSLISSTHVLTAAICYSDDVLTAQHFTVVLGSNDLFNGGVRIVTTDVVLHPDWPIGSRVNELAILRIPAVTFTAAIQPIALPSGVDASSLFVGNWAIASGYGRTFTNDIINREQILHATQVQIITNEECAAVFGSQVVQSTNICTSGTGGVGLCGGDEGGPLALNSNNQRILVNTTDIEYPKDLLLKVAIASSKPSLISIDLSRSSRSNYLSLMMCRESHVLVHEFMSIYYALAGWSGNRERRDERTKRKREKEKGRRIVIFRRQQLQRRSPFGLYKSHILFELDQLRSQQLKIRVSILKQHIHTNINPRQILANFAKHHVNSSRDGSKCIHTLRRTLLVPFIIKVARLTRAAITPSMHKLRRPLHLATVVPDCRPDASRMPLAAACTIVYTQRYRMSETIPPRIHVFHVKPKRPKGLKNHTKRYLRT